MQFTTLKFTCKALHTCLQMPNLGQTEPSNYPKPTTQTKRKRLNSVLLKHPILIVYNQAKAKKLVYNNFQCLKLKEQI